MTQYPLDLTYDKFIVLASDGIWDVMDNDDVANFVDMHRELSKRGMPTYKEGESVSLTNTNISQLLCEEARVRWLTVVERENVIVDDISCIILEFLGTEDLIATTVIPQLDIEEE